LQSSSGVKSGFARHGRALISIILLQTLIIVWLSSWVAGDYLNNVYVRTYVNDTIQADAWILGALALIAIICSSMGLVLRRNKHVAKTVDTVKTHAKIAIPVPSTSSAKLTSQPFASPKSSTDLHPAVAALKADLSDKRIALGLASVAPAASLDNEKAPTGPRPVSTVQSSANVPKPQLSIASQSQQSSAAPPAPLPPATRTVLPPTVIRPMAPTTRPGHSTSAPQLLPVLKIETPATPAPIKPLGLQTRPDTPSPSTMDVSTVITGIVTTQQPKKKDPEPSSEQNSSKPQ
jgi:hypothetical protein